MTDITVLPAQYELLRSTAPIVCEVAGYGAGKTKGATYKALQLAERNGGYTGAFVEPSFRMAKDVAYPEISETLTQLNIPFAWHAADMAFSVKLGDRTSRVLLRSADKPDSLKGMNLAWAIGDEVGQWDEVAAKVLLSRVRAVGAACRQLILIGTPEGGPGTWFGQWAEFSPNPGTQLIRARTADNPYLPVEYIEMLRERLTPEEFRAYCEGFFIAEGGQVYRFDVARHKIPCANPTEGQVQVWADFNVGKMVWVLARALYGEWHVFDEIVSENTYTEEQIKKLRERLADWGTPMNGTPVYCDASAGHRRSTAAYSDLVQLQRAGLDTKALAANPPVKDRVASVNQALNLDRLLVDPRCLETIKCLSSQGRDRNGDPDKDPRKGLDHANDAIGYGIYAQEPVRAVHGNSRYH